MRHNPYSNERWRSLRKRILQANPLCRACEQDGKIVTATVVDHIRPHRGDQELMWNEDNLQPLCRQHHDSWKKRIEKSGKCGGANQDGTPIDPEHHWNE